MPKRGLAADPLDRLVGPAEQDASAPAASSASNASSGSKAPKGRVVVKVVADVAEQARAAVLYRQTHGDPLITLAGYIEAAIRDRLEQDKAVLTGGADFPPAEVQLRRGRRLGTPQS